MIDAAERAVRIWWAVAAGLVFLGSGIAAVRMSRRRCGPASGLARRIGALGAYTIAASLYATACVLLWRRLPLHPSPGERTAMLTAGSVAIAAGLGLYVWGRRALGDMYNVSSVLGSELYDDQRLVTSGPYASVRHPMYVGLLIGAFGALAVYRTWTFVFVIAAFPGAVVKARREDRLLARAMGEEFERYRAAVPGWIPRLRRSPRTRDAIRPHAA